MGKLYYYEIKDYQAAGFHFKTCVELEPAFPGVYDHYLNLLVFLEMEKQVNLVKEKALRIPGVNASYIHYLSGLHSEKKKEWNAASAAYGKAFLEATSKYEKDIAEESIERVKAKKSQSQKYNYQLSN